MVRLARPASPATPSVRPAAPPRAPRSSPGGLDPSRPTLVAEPTTPRPRPSIPARRYGACITLPPRSPRQAEWPERSHAGLDTMKRLPSRKSIAVCIARRGGDGPADDLVAVEEPLEIRFAGETVAVIMRSPG